MSAFDLGATVPIGTSTRVVVKSVKLVLTPPGSEFVEVSYQLTDGTNNPLGNNVQTTTYPMPGAILTAINGHLSTKLAALVGQTATLNGAAGV